MSKGIHKGSFFATALVIALLFPLEGMADRADSLTRLIKVHRDDTAKFELIHELWMEQSNKNIKEAIAAADSALSLAERIDYHKGIARANTMRASCMQHLGQYSAALRLYMSILKIYRCNPPFLI